MRTARTIAIAATLCLGVTTANAESPTKSKSVESKKAAAAEVAVQTAEVAPIKKRVDPLDAALAQALANSETTKPAKRKQTKPAKKVGLKSLHRHTRSAARVKLDRGHSQIMPSNETVWFTVSTPASSTGACRTTSTSASRRSSRDR